MKIRVYYEDTDCGNIVYHSNYLNFCERARSELFFSKGLSPHEGNFFFVVKHMDCDFIKSAEFGDVLDIETKLVELKKASLKLEQIVRREDEKIFRTIVTLVYVKNGRPSKIPEDKLALFS